MIFLQLIINDIVFFLHFCCRDLVETKNPVFVVKKIVKKMEEKGGSPSKVLINIFRFSLLKKIFFLPLQVHCFLSLPVKSFVMDLG